MGILEASSTPYLRLVGIMYWESDSQEEMSARGFSGDVEAIEMPLPISTPHRKLLHGNN